MKCGVYLITNLITGMIYCGSSRCLQRRKRQHWNDLKAGRHTNPHLQHAWDYYKAQAFTFEVVEYCEELVRIERERWWTSLLNSLHPGGYNLIVADHREVSAETRRRLSAALRGRKPCQEAVEGASRYWKGRKHSDETRAKMSAWQIGKEVDQETRERMSTAQKKRVRPKLGRPSPLKGRKRLPFTDEHRANIGAASRARQRQPHSEETKRKMSEAMKRWWQAKTSAHSTHE